MERVWAWVWTRHGSHVSWAGPLTSTLVTFPLNLAILLIVIAYEGSDRYAVAAAIALTSSFVVAVAVTRPGARRWKPLEGWAGGDRSDPASALRSTYTIARRMTVEAVVGNSSIGMLAVVLTAAVGGASGADLLRWAAFGATGFASMGLIAMHSYVEATFRPARDEIARHVPAGDSMPNARPTFAWWSTAAILATAWGFAWGGACYAAVIDRSSEDPLVLVAIAAWMTIAFAVPITVGTAFGPSLRPIGDLTAATKRVAAGDFSIRLPVVQDDDLGVLAASFNRMQAGLAERERLHAAFGSYVDPALATRLLEQGDAVFSGERREVTVMFVDIRDFTPFAEFHTAEETVARLNEVFDIVVPTVVDAGGHVNKFLGDGAMAVFGAPNELANHADAATGAAVRIDELVTASFGATLRIGIGINTGPVIAGTIGGGGKLEFTLIGDAVNVAARIEQLTKTTGDTILATQATVDAMTTPLEALVHRGDHQLKGKTGTIAVHAVAQQRRG